MNYLKKVNPIYLILFILLVGFFIFTPTQTVEAAAQCNADGTVTIASDEIMPIYAQYLPAMGNHTYNEYSIFPGYFDCANFCPGHSLGNATCNYVSSKGGYLCSSSYITAYTFKHGPTTAPWTSSYPSGLDYCTAGIPGGGPGGTYCVPSNYGCQGATLVGENNLGTGWCEKVYTCSSTVFEGQWRTVSASNCSGNAGIQPGCQLQSGLFGYCQFSKPTGSYTETYYCGTSNPPTGVDVDATIWTSSARTTIFSGQNGDGPLWAYSQAPYRISWGAVTNATSCSLSVNSGAPTAVSTSGGNSDSLGWNYTVALNQNTLTYTLTCSNSTDSASDTVTIYIPPKPTINTASCPAPGTTGNFSWVASTQNVGGISTWNTFDTEVTNNTTGVVLGAPGTATNFVGTSKTFTSVAGNAYTWLVKSKHVATGAFSDQITGSFTCIASGSVTDGATCQSINLSPASPTAGQAVTGTVVVNNSGTSVWQSFLENSGPHKLVSQNPQGNTIWTTTQANLPLTNVAIARYVKIEVPSSDSYVAAREVEIYDTNNNKITPVSCTTNGSHEGSCNSVIDNNTNTLWISNDITAPYSGWITLDLGSSRNISRIRVYGESLPSPSSGTLSILTSTDNITFTSRKSFPGYGKSADFGWYLLSYGDPGRSSTFTFSATAPSTSGSYNFDWGMANNTTAFGVVCTVPVTVTPPATGTENPSCDSTPWFTDSGAGTWSSRKIFQIDNGKVPATLSGFPVLISTTTDYNLRSESYGGSVKDASGNDIAFTDSTGTTQLAHEIEKYNPATGELIAWVRVPTLSSAADTKIYMYYGGSITTNQQDVAGTWSTNYRGVWHMGEATGANRVSSINSYAMVEDTGIDIAQATGKIGYAASAGTVNTNKRMQYLTNDLGISTNYTDSFWLKANTEIGTGVYRTVDRRDISTQIGSIIRYEYNSGTRRLVFQRAKLGGTIDAINHNITLGTAGWYHVAVTYNGTTLRAYLNGLEVGNVPASGNGVSGTSEGIATFARMGPNPIDFAPITLDQISSSNTARSAEWIATEYNNQSVAPLGNFYGVSTHCPGANATASITANNQDDSITINSGESADLRWSYSNATSCTITPPPSNPSVYPNGSGGPVSTGALAASRTYTLSCNPGPVSDSVTVNVTPPVGTDYDLCIIKSGQGKISRDPLGTPSVPNCWTYADGENVTLTASIVPGRIFTGWGGDGASCAKNTTCNIIMDSAKSVIANFIVNPNYKEF